MSRFLTRTTRRCFTHGGPGRFDQTSCFTLTPTGAAIIQRWPSGPAVLPAQMQELATKSIIPKWDAPRQELRLGRYLIKQFKLPADRQNTVLCTFEEEKWPPRIDDPLPGSSAEDRKRRLHNTINALNRNQIHPWIHFLGDGRGQGIRWELQSPATWPVSA